LPRRASSRGAAAQAVSSGRIAATALLREVLLVTHDEKLRGVDYLKTIW
jgi:hypothetical protein